MNTPDTVTPAPAPPVIEVTQLVKIFRDFWGRPRVRAVDGVDLTIGHGQIVGLLGPNGSGKSTIIKILLGLLFPSAGKVRVLGRSPRHVAIKQQIGFLPEESHLYRYLTARETLHFYGRLFGLEKAIRRDRANQLLEMTGLVQTADRPVGEFSKGMARRLGLAQALINDPQLLILDEPTAGLDPQGCRQVKDVMLTLARRGKTLLLTSHLLADVEDVCDRIAILYNGRIRAQGAVRELLTVPGRTRIAMPELAPERMQQVLQMLRESIGAEPQVERPTMDLEQFFLRVMEEANAGNEPLAGSVRTGRMAPFLEEQ